MDPLVLSRLQFAVTTIYHFFFVPLTLGLSFTVALMETIYVRSDNVVYKRMAKFWGTLFVINFAMGVVTGIVQEFQFGMNWSEYSRFVGDIFGAPLAIEALLAFFLESVFIGVWIFGWDRLSKGMHAAAMWLVAFASTISAFWILVANSFMQQPVGYAIEGGRAVMTDFFALILNPNVWVQFPHTVTAGFVTAAFFVLGISAYHLLRKSNFDMFKRSFKIAAITGSIAIIVLILNGHSQAQHMIETQPMKMASAEALWNTESPASFSLLTIGDLQQRSEVFSIRLPYLLCLLTYNNLDCEIQGIYDLQDQYELTFGPRDYIPPVAVVYWAFRIMVGIGFLLLALAFYALFMVMGKTFEKRDFSFKIYLWALALPYIANTSGWILTEVGRMPWIVHTLMIVDDGLSFTVPPAQMLTTLLGFTLVYAALIVATIYLMVKYARNVPSDLDSSDVESSPEEPVLVPSSE